MRELPKPDHKAQCDGMLWPDAYSPELVLAIQKQAYEDGLRDAAKRCNEIASGWYASVTGNDAAKECGEEILYMLTASQKDQK